MRKTIIRRLRHEFNVLDMIDHPFIVTMRETGTHDGRVYGILDYADGPPVRSYVYEDEKKPDDAALLAYSIECVKALEAVHDAGYLHGDVHTGNFLIRNNHICLIDFGLSRPIIIKKRDEKKYHQGGVIPYMPPEYVRSIDDDTRRMWGSVSTEIYSCAVVIYSMFTRKYPYEWSTYRKDYMQNILNNPPRSFKVCERRPWPELEAVLQRALAKHAEERFPSMTQFREALEDIAPSAAVGSDPFYGRFDTSSTESGKERV
jgi:serine/threonine-protein kinase